MHFGRSNAFDSPRRRQPTAPAGQRDGEGCVRRRPAVVEHRGPLPQRSSNGRWIAVWLLALLLHGLAVMVLWWIRPHLTDPLERESSPIVVQLIELPPEGDDGVADDGDQGLAERFDEPEPLEARHDPTPPQPPRPAKPEVAEAEPTQRPTETQPDVAPAVATVQDITVDEPVTQARDVATAVARRQYSPFRISNEPPKPSTAPKGVCNTGMTICAYDSGDVIEVGPAAAAALAQDVARGELLAVSDEQLELFRSNHRVAPVARQPVSTPVYSNYGTFPSLYKVDLERLSAAAAGAPYSCSVYPNALNDVDEDPAGLTIIVDSSGSMIDNMYTSPATRCAFAAAQSALEHDIAVTVINFSDKLYVVQDSTDAQRIAEVICKQQKRDTLLPEDELHDFVDQQGRHDMLLVSDGMFANTATALPYLEAVLGRDVANRGFAVLLDSKPQTLKIRDELHAIGFSVTLLRF